MSDARVPSHVDFEAEYNVPFILGMEVFQAHLAGWKARAEQARFQMPDAALDAAYGDSPEQRFDFFPATERVRGKPALHVFIHGGFWRRLSKNEFSWVALPCIQRSTSVAVINYGLAPQVSFERIVENTRQCFLSLWHRAEALGFDRRHISVSGHSAGGHLAAMLLATDWSRYGQGLPLQPFSHALLLSPLSDLAPIMATNFLQADLQLTPAHINALSPALLQPNPGVKIMGVVGALESNEFKRQLRLLHKAWSKEMVDMHLCPDMNHLTVCDQMGDADSPLMQRWRDFASGVAL